MQIVGNWLSSPRHGAPEWRKLHHTHYCANICGTERKSTERHVRCKSKKIWDPNLLFHQLWYLPLKFRLFILKFRGAKGLEDTIFPPGKETVNNQNYKIHFLLIYTRCYKVDLVAPFGSLRWNHFPLIGSNLWTHSSYWKDWKSNSVVWLWGQMSRAKSWLLDSHCCFNQQW